jgi:glycosyltransferase involved in cell wall biosynthesis
LFIIHIVIFFSKEILCGANPYSLPDWKTDPLFQAGFAVKKNLQPDRPEHIVMAIEKNFFPASPELSIVLPCLNEERTVGICIEKAMGFLQKNGIPGEIIIADNGSTDRSVQIAKEHSAIVVFVENKGYGNALKAGFQAASGKYIIMADADDSYDLENLMPFVQKLREGYDLVMGNRFKGGIARDAMPWHHRYIGNPLLSFIGKLFFRTPANDFHCGIRGLNKAAVQKMNLHTAGMEFASEIVIKSSILGMKVCEVPTTLSKDGRDRPPHLRSFRDGWRHLRFLLIYSPRWLFAYPGLFLVLVGSLLSLVLFAGPLRIAARLVDFHSLIMSGTMIILGLNMLSFSTITRVYAYNAGLLPNQPGFFRLFKYFNLEKGLAVGLFIFFIGLIFVIRAVSLSSEFSLIGFNNSIRIVFAGSLALIVGWQVILTSFVMSILGLDISK